MHAQETLSSIFPAGIVTHFRPDFVGSYGVDGLPKDTVPQNCEVLLSGDEKLFISPGDRRTHYLVKANGFTFYFRVCSAMAGSGYDEFVAGLGYAETDEAAKELEARAARSIGHLCAP